ncbi:BON domain-containing protein [Bdellovibrio sp. 22V]|uniref:BON domain-containing protein n=1 Tax=Bdellovibrio sp. 22V TaxID=3044166 RepID=UPI002542CE79|nr:BON domain-containing protein [Bdellovibrio sp. 22V]WII72446.1 BON domain-containing protein [Bdellovibrio sp. 22V]
MRQQQRGYRQNEQRYGSSQRGSRQFGQSQRNWEERHMPDDMERQSYNVRSQPGDFNPGEGARNYGDYREEYRGSSRDDWERSSVGAPRSHESNYGQNPYEDTYTTTSAGQFPYGHTYGQTFSGNRYPYGQSYQQQGNYPDYGHPAQRQSYGSQGYGYGQGQGYEQSRREQSRGYQQDYGSRDRYSSMYEESQSPERYSQSERSEQFTGKGPKNFKRSDERIKDEVCEMLTRDADIDASEIDVDVKEGVVTLTGTVPDRRMKHLAEDCSERCYGVRDVTNQLRVQREGSAEASERSGESSRSTKSSRSSYQQGGPVGH